MSCLRTDTEYNYVLYLFSSNSSLAEGYQKNPLPHGMYKELAVSQAKSEVIQSFDTQDHWDDSVVSNSGLSKRYVRHISRGSGMSERQDRILRWQVSQQEDDPPIIVEPQVDIASPENLKQAEALRVNVPFRKTCVSSSTPLTLNPQAASFTPGVSAVRVEQSPVQTVDQCHTTCTKPREAPGFTANVTRFLLKKDVLMSSLRSYDDQPESYAVWKASFLSVSVELQLSAAEELDLLAKWLGPESVKHAQSLRTVCAGDPSTGLKRLWERLDNRYGCAELVENALKRRLDNFPKLTYNDNKKLYELADLAAEIEATLNTVHYSPTSIHHQVSSPL